MNQNLLRLINKQYDIGEINRFDRIELGKTNLSYELTTAQNHFYFKRYIYQDENRIKTIHNIKSYLLENNIPTVLPLKTQSNQTYFKWDGYYYSLFPFVDGKKYSTTMLTDQALISAAETLAKIHLLSKKEAPPITNRAFKPWSRKLFFDALEPVLQKIKEKSALNEEDHLFLDYINKKITIVQNNQINFQDLSLNCDHFTHGDYQASNLLFDQNDKVSHIFDLEIARIAPRTLEIARAINLICFDADYSEKNFKSGELFIDAYYKLYPLSKKEFANGMKAFYFSILIYTTWIEERHYLANDTRSSSLVENKIESINYFSKNLDYFTQRLSKILN